MTSAADRTSPPRGFAEVWEPTFKGMGRVPSARFEGRASDTEPFLGGVLAPVEGPCSQETKWFEGLVRTWSTGVNRLLPSQW